MSVLGINATTDQPFWRWPDGLAARLGERLPGWEIAIAREPSEIAPLVRRSDAVVGWPFPAALARGARLRFVHFFTAGVPDSWSAVPHVTSMRGANAASVAQHALFLATAALRGAGARGLSAWEPESFGAARAPEMLRAAIAGYGAIGGRLAPLVAPLFHDVRVLSRGRPATLPTGVTYVEAPRWLELVRETDVLFLTLPLTPETRAMFGATFFSALRDGALLVNVARGELLDETALLAWLARSPRNVYATDVAHPEPYPADGALRGVPQVIMTPHVGARREDAWALIERATLAAIDHAIERGVSP